MTRDELIEILGASDFKAFETSPELLDSILMMGFKGYLNYTDEGLIIEYNERLECSWEGLVPEGHKHKTILELTQEIDDEMKLTGKHFEEV